MNTTSLDFVVAELQARKGEWTRISEELPISYHTLTKIAQKRVVNPRFETVQKLSKYLMETK